MGQKSKVVFSSVDDKWPNRIFKRFFLKTFLQMWKRGIFWNINSSNNSDSSLEKILPFAVIRNLWHESSFHFSFQDIR